MAAREDRQEMAELANLDLLPDKYKKLWVANKRLHKQIDVMKMEIAEKDRIIRQLKVEIDSSILEDTKNRLEFVRIVDEEVAEKTQQARQEYIARMAQFEAEMDKEMGDRFEMERLLQAEKDQNEELTANISELSLKIRDLKDHIIVAMDEKDLIINELVKLVSSKDLDDKVQAIKREAATNAEHNFRKYSPAKNMPGVTVPDKNLSGGTGGNKPNKQSKVFIKRNI